MLGSVEDSEDLVQETALRAWRHRAAFEGRASFRAWLYRIATNACLDHLRGRPSRDHLAVVAPLAREPLASVDSNRGEAELESPLEQIEAVGGDPLDEAIDRETIELAFLAAIRHLQPNRRAVLIMRDVLGSSTKETATALSAWSGSSRSPRRRGSWRGPRRPPGVRRAPRPGARR